MKFYAGIDLHSNNSYVVIMQTDQEIVYDKRLPNDLGAIKQALKPYAIGLEGVVVESTYNWYWLVDGLKEAGYTVHLANVTAAVNYKALKHTDDKTDARWLANLLRLGILPTGYIYPKEQRGLREVLRKRLMLVRQQTMNTLSLSGTATRYEGIRISGDKLKQCTAEEFQNFFRDENVKIAVSGQWEILNCLRKEIAELEKYLNKELKKEKIKEKTLKNLKTVPGIGPILATTIYLESGPIQRFPEVGNYVSYCRCVSSERLSNGKKKGENNRKNGNAYLCWSYVEAANHAVRCAEPIQRYYQRKRQKGNHTLAIKAVAHKLARASYYILKNEVPFDIKKAFN